MKNSFKYGLAVSAILACLDSANAGIVNIALETFSGSNTAPAGVAEAVAPASTSGTVFLGLTGSIPGYYLSPYGDSTTAYNVVETGGSATYAVNSFTYSLLWGSPDAYNTLTFYDTLGAIIGTFTGASLSCYTTTCGGTGYDIVSFLSSIEIGSVALSDSIAPAFEFGTISSVPLPGALPLFASAIGAMGLFMRRRILRIA